MPMQTADGRLWRVAKMQRCHCMNKGSFGIELGEVEFKLAQVILYGNHEAKGQLIDSTCSQTFAISSSCSTLPSRASTAFLTSSTLRFLFDISVNTL